jgi:hypothetical protein
VYTNVYQYNNSVITNYTTVPSSYTYTTTLINGPWRTIFIGLSNPDYFKSSNRHYRARLQCGLRRSILTLQYGTAVTDPYRSDIQSPTPWAWFGADAANLEARAGIGISNSPSGLQWRSDYQPELPFSAGSRNLTILTRLSRTCYSVCVGYTYTDLN